MKLIRLAILFFAGFSSIASALAMNGDRPGRKNVRPPGNICMTRLGQLATFYVPVTRRYRDLSPYPPQLAEHFKVFGIGTARMITGFYETNMWPFLSHLTGRFFPGGNHDPHETLVLDEKHPGVLIHMNGTAPLVMYSVNALKSILRGAERKLEKEAEGAEPVDPRRIRVMAVAARLKMHSQIVGHEDSFQMPDFVRNFLALIDRDTVDLIASPEDPAVKLAREFLGVNPTNLDPNRPFRYKVMTKRSDLQAQAGRDTLEDLARNNIIGIVKLDGVDDIYAIVPGLMKAPAAPATSDATLAKSRNPGIEAFRPATTSLASNESAPPKRQIQKENSTPSEPAPPKEIAIQAPEDAALSAIADLHAALAKFQSEATAEGLARITEILHELERSYKALGIMERSAIQDLFINDLSPALASLYSRSALTDPVRTAIEAFSSAWEIDAWLGIETGLGSVIFKVWRNSGTIHNQNLRIFLSASDLTSAKVRQIADKLMFHPRGISDLTENRESAQDLAARLFVFSGTSRIQDLSPTWLSVGDRRIARIKAGPFLYYLETGRSGENIFLGLSTEQNAKDFERKLSERNL